MHPIARLLLPLLLLFAGCTVGPHYAGGPTDEDPYGVVNPGGDITVWAVDGHATASRSFSLLIHPGKRIIKVRIEHPMESDSATPFEYRDLTIEVEQGVEYLITRKPGDHPPYEIDVAEQALPQ